MRMIVDPSQSQPPHENFTFDSPPIELKLIHLYYKPFTMKQLIFFFLVTTLGYSQTISKQVIGTAGKTQTNSNLKVSWTTGEPVGGLMTAGGNQLGNGYYPAMDIQALSIDDALIYLEIRVGVIIFLKLNIDSFSGLSLIDLGSFKIRVFLETISSK
jgi:hypothetical protein